MSPAEKLPSPKGNNTASISIIWNLYPCQIRAASKHPPCANLIPVGNVISFGPEIKPAKVLVDNCLSRWSEGANANLKAVVLDAFDVDRQGSMNVGKILALRRLDIDDDEWKRAMQAISDSVRVDVTKDYVRLHRRGAVDAKWELVSFDLSKLDVSEV
ncbi:DUF3164 family protein [Acetobacter fabarum]|uniref:DUF3164 family protein n=1 Tax=Acetobacter fabarum TaxID=483199 RepID=UPI00209E4205|nr:DUF3164 family protein [Acetobacter fabarum]MCP1227963.1 DUF3164 family protein [Acetobacter fabarum]MCP1233459.1 DUF3164 family protein [Acetobacter fabarum]